MAAIFRKGMECFIDTGIRLTFKRIAVLGKVRPASSESDPNVDRTCTNLDIIGRKGILKVA